MLHSPFTNEEVAEILQHIHALELIFHEHGYTTYEEELIDIEEEVHDEQIHMDK